MEMNTGEMPTVSADQPESTPGPAPRTLIDLGDLTLSELRGLPMDPDSNLAHSRDRLVQDALRPEEAFAKFDSSV